MMMKSNHEASYVNLLKMETLQSMLRCYSFIFQQAYRNQAGAAAAAAAAANLQNPQLALLQQQQFLAQQQLAGMQTLFSSLVFFNE